MTNDVLHLSRLRLGRSVLEESCFCVEELVGNIVRMFQAEALAYHVELAYRYAADKAGVPLRGDVQRISQIIVNLLANAIKFTRLAPTRQVVVETWVDLAGDADPEPGRHTVIVSVHDTGIGMTAEERAQLFVPFRQATAHTHVAYGGSGLGLFITKQLLELMGGGINVDSTPGVGTTFTIEIPVHLMADDAHADSGSAMKGSEGLAAGPMAADHDDDDAYEHEHAASMGSSRHNDMVEAVAPGRMAMAGTSVFPQPDHQVPHLPLPIRILGMWPAGLRMIDRTIELNNARAGRGGDGRMHDDLVCSCMILLRGSGGRQRHQSGGFGAPPQHPLARPRADDQRDFRGRRRRRRGSRDGRRRADRPGLYGHSDGAHGRAGGDATHSRV